MTTWAELRTVALVGTERRSLPASTPGPLGDLAANAPSEARALSTAAVLGVARDAGRPLHPAPRSVTPYRDAEPDPAERFAPDQATQLLDLILSGNAGPGNLSEPLLRTWLERCGELGYVLPHHLLVRMLDRATTPGSLRSQVPAVLGVRGRWLAARRSTWAWASSTAPDDVDPNTSIDELLELRAAERDRALTTLRIADPDAGRRLVAEAFERLDASSRAAVLECLAAALTVDDEPLLEQALDDRSKRVRGVAIALLEQLPDSARASRLASQLAPLVSKTGDAPVQFEVRPPGSPDDEQRRDLPPDGTGIEEHQWFDALVVGTPLGWWEQTLDATPDRIVRADSHLGDELRTAWKRAALAQRNLAWLEALFDTTRDPALLPSLGATAAKIALVDGIDRGESQQKLIALLVSTPAPWPLDFSRLVIDWLRTAGDGKGVQTRLNQVQLVLADALHPDTQRHLTAWLEQARGDELQGLQRALRTIIQHLSMRSNVEQAFLHHPPTEPMPDHRTHAKDSPPS